MISPTKDSLYTVADPEGALGVRSNPLPAPPPPFLLSYENEIIWSQ